MQIRYFILTAVFLGAAAFLPNYAFAEKNGAAGQSEPQNTKVHTIVSKNRENPMTSEKAVPVPPENVNINQGRAVQKPVTKPNIQQTVPKIVPKSPNKTNKSIGKVEPSLEKNIKASKFAERAARVKATGQKAERAVKVKATGQKAERAARVKATGQPSEWAARVKAIGQKAERAAKVKATGKPSEWAAKVKNIGQPTEPATKVKDTEQPSEPAVKLKDTGQTGRAKPNVVTNKLPEVPMSRSSNQTNSEAETNSEHTGLKAKSEAFTKDTESPVSVRTSRSLALVQKPLINKGNKTPSNNRKNLGDIEIMNTPPQRTQSFGGQSNELFSPGAGTISFSANRFDWDEYFGLILGHIYTSRQAKYCHQWINAPPSPPPQAAPFF